VLFPQGPQDSLEREELHLLARLDRGTSVGGTSARGAFAHPLEHVGELPADLPESAKSSWALALCSGLSGWNDKTQRGKVGSTLKSSFWQAPPQMQVSSSRDGGTYEKNYSKNQFGVERAEPQRENRRPRPGLESVLAHTATTVQQFPSGGAESTAFAWSKSLQTQLRGSALRLLKHILKHLLALAVQSAREAEEALRTKPAKSCPGQQQQFDSQNMVLFCSSVNFQPRFSTSWSQLPAKH